MIKSKIRQMAAGLTVILFLFTKLCPDYINAADVDFSKYDQTGDGNLYLEDFQIMLDQIIDNAGDIDKKFDVNQDGVASVEDLNILRLYGENNGGDSDYIGYIPPLDDAQLQVEYTESEITVDVIVMGGRIGYFDYALLYDKDKLKVKNVEWSKDFLGKYGEDSEQSFSFFTNRLKDGDIILAGCYNSNNSYRIGKLARITFSYMDDEKDSGELNLVYHQSKYKNDMELLRQNVCRRTQGDVDNNHNIELSDAQKILAYALKIETFDDPNWINYLDMDGDGVITLEDASIVLKQALKILPQMETRINYF